MRVTLLGTGDGMGMPVPLCDCEYCTESDPRTHPAVLIETDETTIVLDAGPQIPEQLRAAGVTDPDAFFVTHAHRDHAWGLIRFLGPAKFPAALLESADKLVAADPESYTPNYTVNLTATAQERLEEMTPLDRLDIQRLTAGEPIQIGEITVDSFPVDHARPELDTLGFAVEADGRTVGYAPDILGYVGEPPAHEFDLFITEGSSALGSRYHGPPEERRAAIDAVAADRTILVNVTEHILQAHTEELEERAQQLGYELGNDFQTIDLA